MICLLVWTGRLIAYGKQIFRPVIAKQAKTFIRSYFCGMFWDWTLEIVLHLDTCEITGPTHKHRALLGEATRAVLGLFFDSVHFCNGRHFTAFKMKASWGKTNEESLLCLFARAKYGSPIHSSWHYYSLPPRQTRARASLTGKKVLQTALHHANQQSAKMRGSGGLQASHHCPVQHTLLCTGWGSSSAPLVWIMAASAQHTIICAHTCRFRSVTFSCHTPGFLRQGRKLLPILGW